MDIETFRKIESEGRIEHCSCRFATVAGEERPHGVVSLNIKLLTGEHHELTVNILGQVSKWFQVVLGGTWWQR